MIYVALGLIVLGVLVGASGMKNLGRFVRVTGPWRPGAALLALIAFAGGLLMLIKGAALEGVLLLAGALVLSLTARKRPASTRPGGGMAKRDAEQILGVDAGATPAQIEEAYRRLMRRAHPDTGGSPGLAAQLNAARNTLSKPQDRRGRTTGRGAEVQR